MTPFLFDLLLMSLGVAHFVRSEFAVLAITVGFCLLYYWWRMAGWSD